MRMKHVIFYSGGLGSWMTAKRVVQAHGAENVICLFTDTLIEDEDLYRFLIETTQDIYGIDQRDLIKLAKQIPPTGHETMEARKAFLTDLAAKVCARNPNFVWINDGRDPWEIFRDVKFLGNSRIAQCSHVIKQGLAEKYVKANYKPETQLFIKDIDYKKKMVTYWEDEEVIAKLRKEWQDDERETCKLYLGIDWTEEHRTKSPRFNWLPYAVEFPMCEEPLLTKIDAIKALEEAGIAVPRLYGMNFSHNNCGGFCVRAGQGHFVNLLEKNRELYLYHEEKEQEMRDYLGKDVSMLKRSKTVKEWQEPKVASAEELDLSEYDPDFDDIDAIVDLAVNGGYVKKNKTFRLTLRQLREEVEANQTEQIDMFDIGGCGCFSLDTEGGSDAEE
jgi:hypothetical protein